jgi:Tfp pilus assembly PilM family ATPase
MKFSFGTPVSPIGLDLGAHSIKAVQFDGNAIASRLIAASCFPRKSAGAPLETRELERIREVLGRQGFKGNDVVVFMPPEKVMTSVLELPARTGEIPMDEIACEEFCRVHKKDPEAVTASFWELPPSARGRRSTFMMASGWLSADADEFLDTIENAGLCVVAVDVATSATARACKTDESELTGILDLGWTAAVIGIVKSDVLIYERRIPEAGHAQLLKEFVADVSDSADAQCLIQKIGLLDPQTGDADESDVHEDCRSRISNHCNKMLEEIRQAFSYARHQYPEGAPSLVLTGGAAGIPGLAPFLAKALDMKVSEAETGHIAASPDGNLKAAMISAIGLARFGSAVLSTR